MSPETNDQDAIVSVLAGSLAAFEPVVQRYHRPLYFYVVGKVTDDGEAEDIVQKTFVTAYQSLSKYDPKQPLIGWLRGIALNHCRNEWRRYQSQSRLRGQWLEVRRSELQGSLLDEPRTDGDQHIAALQQCMEKLNESERQGVKLRFIEETSLECLGRILGKTTEGARLWLFRIRIRLRNCMNKRLALKGVPN